MRPKSCGIIRKTFTGPVANIIHAGGRVPHRFAIFLTADALPETQVTILAFEKVNITGIELCILVTVFGNKVGTTIRTRIMSNRIVYASIVRSRIMRSGIVRSGWVVHVAGHPEDKHENQWNERVPMVCRLPSHSART